MSNGYIGVAAMVYARPTVPLRAKKSWFFFDNYILALGSDIFLPETSVTGQVVSTTLNQVIIIILYYLLYYIILYIYILYINSNL